MCDCITVVTTKNENKQFDKIPDTKQQTKRPKRNQPNKAEKTKITVFVESNQHLQQILKKNKYQHYSTTTEVTYTEGNNSRNSQDKWWWLRTNMKTTMLDVVCSLYYFCCTDVCSHYYYHFKIRIGYKQQRQCPTITHNCNTIVTFYASINFNIISKLFLIALVFCLMFDYIQYTHIIVFTDKLHQTHSSHLILFLFVFCQMPFQEYILFFGVLYVRSKGASH